MVMRICVAMTLALLTCPAAIAQIGSQPLKPQGSAAQLAGHMFFAGIGAWRSLFQTHPPLDERIRRLNCPTVISGQGDLSPARELSLQEVGV
jgi:Zn-dependent protease with chaperone function